MVIINKGVGSVAHKIDSNKEVFDPEIRRIYEEGYKNKEHILNGGSVEAVGGGTWKPLERLQDVPEFRKRMIEEKKHAEKGAPVPLTPQQKDELWKKAKALKAVIREGMVSKRDIHPVKTRQIIKNGETTVATVVDNEQLNKSKAIDRNKAWYKKNEGNLRELRRICRILDPNAKIEGMIERWRPQ